MFRKYFKIKNFIIIFLCILIILSAALFLKGSNYMLSSMMFAVVSCFPFYYKYEVRKPDAREFVVVAVMVTLAVVSRILFSFIPGFSPVIAIIIISGAIFGAESGFMCGSLTAIISNIFFGQGPWSLYQMLLWGLIGFFAGILNKKGFIDNKYIRNIYAVVCGFMFSILIDFLTALESGFTVDKFLALAIAAIPFMIYYSISNVAFLFFLYKPLSKKLNRVKRKYGLIEDSEKKYDV